MNPVSQGQVQLSKLIFTMNWEDPLSDERALQIKKNDVVFTITSGGCNAIGFLRFEPSTIHCVDINPAQTYVMELKQAAFRRLNHPDLTAFFGLQKIDRLKIYGTLKKDLSNDALRFWDHHQGTIKRGILMNGRYEKFVKLAGTLLRTMQGSRRTRSFFKLNSCEEQKAFYEREWDNGRWRWIFKTMFNKKRLAKKGLNADYFHFDDGSMSFSESFYKRATQAMINIPCRENYFLALYLLGHFLDGKNIPPYLQEQNYEVIKKNIERIKPVTYDSKYWLEQQPGNVFDAMSLSNICELMDENDTGKFFYEVSRTAKPGARVIFRNLMVPRDVPPDLQTMIVKHEQLSKEIAANDRSFVYGKVASYQICK